MSMARWMVRQGILNARLHRGGLGEFAKRVALEAFRDRLPTGVECAPYTASAEALEKCQLAAGARWTLLCPFCGTDRKPRAICWVDMIQFFCDDCNRPVLIVKVEPRVRSAEAQRIIFKRFREHLAQEVIQNALVNNAGRLVTTTLSSCMTIEWDELNGKAIDYFELASMIGGGRLHGIRIEHPESGKKCYAEAKVQDIVMRRHVIEILYDAEISADESP